MTDTIKNDEDTMETALLPAVSVVIISKNNHGLLEQAVASIGQAEYPKHLLQLVVLEETDTPRPLAEGVEYHTIPMRHKGFGFARNTALAFARNPIIVFTDDDCIVHGNWLTGLVEPLVASKEVSAVSGAVFVPPCGVVGKCENVIGFPGGGMRYYHLSGGKQRRHPTFSTCNVAVRRSVIDSAGGFDESMKYGGEDERISRHIGRHGTIIYNPDAIVYHKPRDSIGGVFKWFIRRGYADVHHALVDKKSSYSLSGFFKNAVLFRFAVLAAFSVLTRLGSVLFLPVTLVYYAMLLRKFRWSYRYYPSLKVLCMVPVVRTAMDTGRDWGIVKGLFSVYRNKWKQRKRAFSDTGTLRVGYFSNHAGIVGGGELSFIDLVDTIRNNGVESVVFVPGRGEVAGRLTMRGITAVMYDLPPLRFGALVAVASALVKLSGLLRKHRVRIVHTNGARCMLLVGLAAKLSGVPVVWHVRVIERDGLLEYIRAFFADSIIVNSDAVKKALQPFCGRTCKIEVIHNGIDISRYSDVEPLNLRKVFALPDGPVVLAVGRLCEWKRFHVLIEACGLVNKNGVPFTCLIIGKNAETEKEYCARLRAMPHEKGIDNVVFGEWRSDVPSIMRAATMLVLPSDNEPFGRVIIEAWASGLPLIATDAGGPAELITDTADGLLVPVDDPHSMAQKIQLLLSDPELRERLSARGRIRAEGFTLEEHAKKVRSHYVRITG